MPIELSVPELSKNWVWDIQQVRIQEYGSKNDKNSLPEGLLCMQLPAAPQEAFRQKRSFAWQMSVSHRYWLH